MTPIESRFLALSLMQRHHLVDAGWTFRFSRGRRTCGQCWIESKRIELSEPVARVNGEEVVRQIVLHEIAHAITGKREHSQEWKEVATAIGCTLASGEMPIPTAPVGKWRYWCANCRTVVYRYRRPRKEQICGRCSGGRKDDRRFVMEATL